MRKKGGKNIKILMIPESMISMASMKKISRFSSGINKFEEFNKILRHCTENP